MDLNVYILLYFYYIVKKLINQEATYDNIINITKEVFTDDCDIGFFYFSGHGYDDENDGKLVTYDYDTNHYGIRFRDIIEIVNSSKCKNKIVILDCCFSGKIGNYKFIGDATLLPLGTTIMTSCSSKETALEINRHGVFTNLLLLALKGGASDLFGRVSPGSIYSYIDSSLGDFEQRPLFKSHVNSFITIRNASKKADFNNVRKMLSLFKNENDKFQLDPSFEPTNYPGCEYAGKDGLKKPYYLKENGDKFSLLQMGVRNALVRPCKEEHMYFAAMKSDCCQLTDLGKHYYILYKKDIF